MGYFERRFVRPTHLHVIETLEQAVEEANEAGQAVDLDREQWEAFLAYIREQPEGVREWVREHLPYGGAGGMGVAWWTDFLKRRHFRIWAGSTADGSYQRLYGYRQPRPPIWHIAPENIFGRSRGEQPEWLAVCACGMTGSPDAIGWMGTNCGCCHYKPAECPEDDPVRFAAWSDAGVRLHRLIFSPDGRWLAAAGTQSDIHVWDVQAGSYHGTIRPGNVTTQALTFSPDSRSLALVCSDRLVHFFNVATGHETTAFPSPKGATSIVIAPDNLSLTIIGERALEIWGRKANTQPWQLLHAEQGHVRGVAFDARGDRLAAVLDWWDTRLYRFVERGAVPKPHPWSALRGTVGTLAFRGDGTLLVLVEKTDFGRANQLSVMTVDLEHNKTIRELSLRCKGAARALSPDADWIAGTEGSSVVVENLRDGRQWTRLLSSQRGNLAAAAFSPDGRTLATVGEEGIVKLWPWRRLIG